MELSSCPRCGSELTCDVGLTKAYCVSKECGAIFEDINLEGLAHRSDQPDSRPDVTSTTPADHATRG